MHYLALATDYDETIADNSVVDKPTLAALERLRGAARRLILVTGREFTDLQRVMPRLDLFDLVVAENGAVRRLIRSEDVYNTFVSAVGPLRRRSMEANRRHLRLIDVRLA
jgi:HAD superfamily hydrolase (TIGR01484 family)